MTTPDSDWTIIAEYDYPVRVNRKGQCQRKDRWGRWVDKKPRVNPPGSLRFGFTKNWKSVYVDAGKFMYETFIGPVPRNRRVGRKDKTLENIAVDNLFIKPRKKDLRKRPKVEKVTANGTVLAVYPGITAAAEANHCSRETIYKRCNGLVKRPFHCGSFSFRYEEVSG